jgi:hypothetical protein
MRNARDVDDDLDDLSGYLVWRVNLHAEAMRRMNLNEAIRYVRGIIDQNDVVIGVFVDTSDPEGIAVRVIKGTREVVAVNGRREGLRIDAVPCNTFEEAIVAAPILRHGLQTRH